jgi:hypothetical protein
MPLRSKPLTAGISAVDVGEIEKRVADWVSSTDGTQQLLEARKRAKSIVEEVAADTHVDREQLRQAVKL